MLNYAILNKKHLDNNELVKSDLFKIYIIGKNLPDENQDILQYLGASLFLVITEENVDTVTILPNYPIINYNNELTEKLISFGRIYPINIINLPMYVNFTKSKVNFHKILTDCDFLPTTVFSKREAEHLKFPIVAKIESGKKGQGLKVFNSVGPLRSSTENFNVFSEFINIKSEYRMIFYKDKLIKCYDRNKVTDISKKKSDDKIEFNMGISNLPDTDKTFLDMQDICLKVIGKLNSLQYLAFDLAVDVNGKVWLIEANSKPGFAKETLPILYKFIFEDFYKRQMNKVDFTKLQKIAQTLLTIN